MHTHTISEMKNSLSGFISRQDTAEERIGEHTRSIEIIQTETQREKRVKKIEYPGAVRQYQTV